MRPYIGQNVIYKNKVHHVQDNNNLTQSSKIGIPDVNNLIWIEWIYLEEIKK